MQAFNHFLHHHDKEAYSDATPPFPSKYHELTGFSNVYLGGGQFGNLVHDGTLLKMFKFRSLSGYLICRCDGQVAWKLVRQDQPALSSCETEIVATSVCMTELLGIRHHAADLRMPDAEPSTMVFNVNKAAAD